MNQEGLPPIARLAPNHLELCILGSAADEGHHTIDVIASVAFRSRQNFISSLSPFPAIPIKTMLARDFAYLASNAIFTESAENGIEDEAQSLPKYVDYHRHRVHALFSGGGQRIGCGSLYR